MIATIIEEAINQMLVDKNINTDKLLDKVIAIKITNLYISLTIIFNSYRIIVLSKEVDNLGLDINITMDSKTIVELIQKQNSKELIANDRLVIVGDIKSAQVLFDIMTKIDLESILLHHINNTINKVKNKLDNF